MAMKIFIGWDSRFEEPALVAAHSMRRRSAANLDIRFLDLANLTKYYGFHPTPDPKATTEFTRSRFLVPWLCGYEGCALFVDNDVICLTDISLLWEMYYPAPKFALRVVQHDYRPALTTKMYGVPQEGYPRKNWSSVMFLNCEKLRCWTKEVVETAEPARLHRFADIPNDRIGGLPAAWNSLDCIDDSTKLVHWTSGGPWNDNTKSWPHQEVWLSERKAWLAHVNLPADTPVKSMRG